MSVTPAEQIVDAMIAAIERRDLEAAISFMADDIEYDNVPIGKVFGPDAVHSTLAPFLAAFDAVEWKVLHQAAGDHVVLNERVDRFRRGDEWLELAVAGVFEVADGKIRLWRDYFDLAAFSSAFAPR